MTATPRTEYLQIGRIGRSRGLHGDLWVTPDTEWPERFSLLERVWLGTPRGWTEFEIEAVDYIGDRPVIKLVGIDSPEQARELTNARVGIPPEQRLDLPADRYYIFDLIGAVVIRESDGQELGVIDDIRAYPANDVYIITTKAGNEVLFPAVRTFVKEIDVARRRIVVDPAGLFDEPDSVEGKRDDV